MGYFKGKLNHWLFIEYTQDTSLHTSRKGISTTVTSILKLHTNNKKKQGKYWAKTNRPVYSDMFVAHTVFYLNLEMLPSVLLKTREISLLKKFSWNLKQQQQQQHWRDPVAQGVPGPASDQAVISVTEDKAQQALWVFRESCLDWSLQGRVSNNPENPRHKIAFSLTTGVTASLSHFNIISSKVLAITVSSVCTFKKCWKCVTPRSTCLNH